MAKHVMVPPPSLREKLPTLSPVVEQVVMTALAKDPRQRFSQVQDFADALEQASRSEVSQTIPASRSPQPAHAPTNLSPSQPSPEFVASVSQSFIPTELVTHASQSSIPTGRSTPANPTSLPTLPVDTPATSLSPFNLQSPSQQGESQPTPRFGYKQLMRDILVVLGVGLSFYLDLLWIDLNWFAARTGLVVLQIVIFFLFPYVIGILAAALSGRKGFDALFPVFIGCIVGIAAVFLGLLHP